MSCKVKETEKAPKLKEIENRLVDKCKPDVILEGSTINMDPMDIIIDESIPKSKYPKAAMV